MSTNEYTSLANYFFQLDRAGLLCPMCGVGTLRFDEQQKRVQTVCDVCQLELDATDPEPRTYYDEAGWPYYEGLNGERWYLT